MCNSGDHLNSDLFLFYKVLFVIAHLQITQLISVVKNLSCNYLHLDVNKPNACCPFARQVRLAKLTTDAIVIGFLSSDLSTANYKKTVLLGSCKVLQDLIPQMLKSDPRYDKMQNCLM